MPNRVISSETYEAAAQLGANLCAAVTSAGLAELAGADSVICIGVIQDSDTLAPFPTEVAYAGIVEVTSDGTGALAPGDKLACAASGKVKKRDPADGTTARQELGICLSTAAATDGLLVRVLLTLNGFVGA